MELLKVENLQVYFPIKGGILGGVVDHVKAVDKVTFTIEAGRTYGLVGESGSGKSTTGRAIIGLEKIKSGRILFDGEDITKYVGKNRSNYRCGVQMIFQDALSSLNPKKRVLDIIAEPLRNFEKLSRPEELKRVTELLEIVGMGVDALTKYPFEFSGGQRQRLGIARAVALHPKLIIADEPVSALDLSVQAQVLNFMKDIQKELGLTYLFISHDMGVIKHMCDDIAIMHRGRFVEMGSRDDVYKNPIHIYTKRLIAAIPETKPEHRDANARKRLAVAAEYKEKYNDYYFKDKDGQDTVYDLKKISERHSVAMP